MYFHEDTVMRMILQAFEAYRRLMRILDDDKAEQELDHDYLSLIGMDRKTAYGLSIASLTDLLQADRRLALFELLQMEARRFAQRMQEDELLELKRRALMVLCSIEHEDIARLRCARARTLFDECASACAAEDIAPLLRFLVTGGAYADAEDVLFFQMRNFGRPADMRTLVQAGEAMYDSLLRLPDQALIAGNLPREEVLEGLAALGGLMPAAGGAS